MELTSDSAPRGAFKAIASSLPVRFALVPVIGYGAARGLDSGFAGLGIAVLLLVCILVGLKLQDELRRRRAARAHIAGLSQW